MTVDVIHADCRDALRAIPDASIDSVVTDPPYEIDFMGKAWDSSGIAFDPAVWRECLRVLKPGGHLLAFGGARTYHRMACAIEDAGFFIRDQIMWLYGSGFPKSLSVPKAIDAALGTKGTFGAPKSAAHAAWIERGSMRGDQGHAGYQREWMKDADAVVRAASEYAAASDEARAWDGWGTALKPAHEPIVVARKPLIGTVAANVMQHGTGAINIDACRVPGVKPDTTRGAGGNNGRFGPIAAQGRIVDDGCGRWPANVIHDGSDEVLAAFPDAPGQLADASSSSSSSRKTQNVFGTMRRGNGREGEPSADSPNDGALGFQMRPRARRNDSGSAARFFYCAKASVSDRNTGVENNHPTVKPLDLMRWLVRLVTPPGGVVLDPFGGSGSTGRAADIEGLSAILIEKDAEHARIARARIRGDAPLFNALP